MTDTIKAVLTSGMRFGTAMAIVKSVAGVVSIDDIVSIATVYGDTPFVTSVTVGSRDWQIFTAIINTTIADFRHSDAYTRKKNVFDTIEGSSVFISTNGTITTDTKTFRTRDDTLYRAWWTVFHPIDDSFVDGTPEDIFTSLNEKDIGVDNVLDAIMTIRAQSA